MPVRPRLPRFWATSTLLMPNCCISLTATWFGACRARIVLASSWVDSCALVPCEVRVASAPPTSAKLMPAAEATGRTVDREPANSCMLVFAAPLAATSWLVTLEALPAGML